MASKVYKIKRGCISYREKIEFKTVLHELYWKLTVRIKGFKVKDVTEKEIVKKRVLK